MNDFVPNVLYEISGFPPQKTSLKTPEGYFGRIDSYQSSFLRIREFSEENALYLLDFGGKISGFIIN